MRPGLAFAALAALGGCWKVPIDQVNAGFLLADATWFAAEETLFVFYEVEADQGIGEPSVIEITWLTDTERVDWTPLDALSPVHTHVPVDCGPRSLCGSWSLDIPDEPRQVGLRLRYHRDGELALEPSTNFNVVADGPPHAARSAVVYGVFDERNEQIQWRLRHQFPTIRNMQASDLGLRRLFQVSDAAYGDPAMPDDAGPFAYGASCGAGRIPTQQSAVETEERAIFAPEKVPVAASTATAVCARSTVFSPVGPFTITARARKNVEVRSSFPVVRSPVEEARPIRFFLAPCEREISQEHLEMQRQRQLSPEDEIPVTCIDRWRDDDFVDRLAALFRDRVNEERAQGEDMVLIIGLHRDEPGMALVVEQALARVAPPERGRNTPRLVGAWVFDSDSRSVSDPGVSGTTLWCPASAPTDDLPDTSARSCPTLPDIPGLVLGPFQVGALPILPTRRQYLNFIEDFSVGTSGKVTDLSFRAPTFPTTSRHVDFGDFGVVTFLNDETIDAAETHAFSYCAPDGFDPFLVSSPTMRDPEVAEAIRQACEEGALTIPEICDVANIGMVPLSILPLWHQLVRESEYDLGLFWEFPFLVRMNYETSIAGSVSAFGLSVPFGVASPAEGLAGSAAWAAESFSLDPTLSQCTRFCDHPTFDAAGAYQVFAPFDPTFTNVCYLPRFPRPTDGGFPFDP